MPMHGRVTGTIRARFRCTSEKREAGGTGEKNKVKKIIRLVAVSLLLSCCHASACDHPGAARRQSNRQQPYVIYLLLRLNRSVVALRIRQPDRSAIQMYATSASNVTDDAGNTYT